MANRTVKDAQSIHGTNPQYLIEKIIRTRIYDSKYWKEQCFALTAELLVDKAMELKSIGGIYGGNIKPTPFICLTLKMLQIQPEKDIIIEFIKQDDFKYVRALGAFYLRLVYSSLDCYKYLEPLLNDYRKLRIMDRSGHYLLTHMDEYIDVLMRVERYCDIMLPRLLKRWVHESSNELDARVSLLDDDLDDLESESDEEEAPPPAAPPPNRRDDIRSGREERHLLSRRSPQRNGVRVEREKRHRSRERGRERDIHERKRRRSRSRERKRKSPPGRYHKRRERPPLKDKLHNYDRDAKRRGREERGKEREQRERGRDHDKERRRHHKRDKERKADNNVGSENAEIAEANALRAKLGMAPLRK